MLSLFQHSKNLSLRPRNNNMSGGVSLSDEQEQKQKLQEDVSNLNNSQSTVTAAQKKASFLSLRQLNCLVLMIVLSASGMVSLADFGFVVFSLIYTFFLVKVAFSALNPPKDYLIFHPKPKILRTYMTLSAIIGLYLPIAYILEGILEGDEEGIKEASKHVFFIAGQVFMEGVVFTVKFPLPLRVFVPVFYNSRRIFTVMEWLTSEFSRAQENYAGSWGRLYCGRALAVANMAFWCFNLFGFLLPVYMPKVFQKYYSVHRD